MKTRTLEEAIRKGYLKIGDKVELDKSILPLNDVTYIGCDSGKEGLQVFIRNNVHFYYAGQEKDNVVRFVATRTTGDKLQLIGEKGFENGLWIMNKICSDLFSTKSLGIYSTPLKFEEFIEYFEGEDTQRFTGKITSRGEAILATPYIKRNDSELNGESTMTYGFKTFLGYIALIEGGNECLGMAGIVPTIRMHLPNQIIFKKKNGKVPVLSSNN